MGNTSTSTESGGGDAEITTNNQTENNETDEPDQSGDEEREENDSEVGEVSESIAGSSVLESDLSTVDKYSSQAVANPSSASSLPSDESLSELKVPLPTSANVAGVWGHETTSTVEIGHVGRATTIETLTYYLENNTRSGGGPLQRIRQDRITGRCYATFEDALTAYRVASRQHRLDNEVLEVSLYPSPNQQLEPACTVSVRNFHIPSTTEDNLRHYFENPRSGGGEVIGVTVHSRKVKEPIAYVCFRRAQDASSVASTEHTLNGKQLKVHLVRPPVALPSVLSLHGLAGNVEAEHVRDFIEVKTGQAVYDIRFGQVKGVALVVFQNDIDWQCIESALKKNHFVGRKLTASSVDASSTAEVHNLPQVPSVSPETLTNYFNNTGRSGGGGVIHVQLLGDKRSALVTFDDPEVCAQVVSQPHVFCGQELDLCVHISCLGVSHGHQTSFSFRLKTLLLLSLVFLAAIGQSIVLLADRSFWDLLAGLHPDAEREV